MKKSVPLALLTLLAVLGCSFGSLVARAPTPTVTPTRTLKPTFTATPTDTPTPVATDTPTPTDTPTSTSTPTNTPTPLPPTPTPTRRPPTATPTPPAPAATPTPSFEFIYEEGSMQTTPNCGTVYLKVKVVGVGGTPANDITVRLQFAGITTYKITGRGDPGQPLGGEPAGEVGFAPLALDRYHAPMDFHIQLVQSPSDPTPRSNEKIVHFTDCDAAGAFTNIKFVYQW